MYLSPAREGRRLDPSVLTKTFVSAAPLSAILSENSG